MSKFGHKGGANCLCIFPKTMYLRKAVLLDDLASWRTRDHPCFFVTTDKLAYADFRRRNVCMYVCYYISVFDLIHHIISTYLQWHLERSEPDL